MKPWILAARPKTLPAAVVPVCVGVVLHDLITTEPGIDWLLVICTLLSAIAIQIATNFFNDALDAKKGADTEKRLGPIRASASGLIDVKTVMLAGWITLGVAIAFSIPLVLARGWPIIAIGVVSMFCAYAYTGGPFPLAYRGMGEIFVVFFFGIVAVTGTMFVLGGTFELRGVLVGLQVGLYSAVLIAINNIRDREEDASSRKFTLAVVLGQRFAKFEVAVLCLLPLVLGGIYYLAGLSPWTFAVYPLALLPLSLTIIFKVMRTPPGTVYNRYLALSALQLVGFAVLFTIARG